MRSCSIVRDNTGGWSAVEGLGRSGKHGPVQLVCLRPPDDVPAAIAAVDCPRAAAALLHSTIYHRTVPRTLITDYITTN